MELESLAPPPVSTAPIETHFNRSLQLLHTRLNLLQIVRPAARIELIVCDNCGIVCCAGLVLLAGGGRAVSQRPLRIEMVRGQLYSLLSQRQGFLGLLRIEPVKSHECPTQPASLL